MEKAISRRGFVGLAGASLATMLLSACANGKTDEANVPGASAAAGFDYMVLVNSKHKVPKDWEEHLDLVEEKSLLYDDPVRVERKAYEAWQGLKAELAAEDVYVELDSCYRSMADQQAVIDEFTQEYGAEYARQIVAEPGTSEHQTGLALDLFLVIDGVLVAKNEEMMEHPEVWEKVHAKLADHGFILRYPPRKAIFTECTYEPWHMRYIDDPTIAHQIMDSNTTFEQYLGMELDCIKDCTVDYGTPSLYSDYAIDSTVDVILREFETWDGCHMTRFAYAGDDACGEDELAYVNELRASNEPELEEFGQAIVMVTDFRSPSAKKAQGSAWEPDTDYKDYTWHLGRKDDDDQWHIMSYGYA
ncbi:MAG: M15 family metallopeptidase [Coriobacteriales bacterium]|nr:M15 family metallopeptidase [Coriobacteriales bacterium]